MLNDWRIVPGHLALEVTSCGRVRRGLSSSRTDIVSGFEYRLQTCKQGYRRVTRSHLGRVNTFRVHILVALTFLGPKPAPEYQVNHKDGDKTNNHVENLEWVTPSKNSLHAVRTGLSKVKLGGETNNVKLTPSQVKFIRQHHQAGHPQFGTNPLAEKFSVCRDTIRHIMSGKTWGHL